MTTLQQNEIDEEMAPMARPVGATICNDDSVPAMHRSSITSSGRADSANNDVNLGTKVIILAALCSQNTVYTLLRRYSYGVLHEQYSAQSALLVGEVLKLVFSAWMTLRMNSSDAKAGVSAILGKLSDLVKTSGRMCALAGIYGLMNILGFFSLRRVDAAVFTVCAQLKILTTAGFAVTVLGKQLTSTKWRALILLVLACILVTVPQLSVSAGKAQSQNKADTPQIEMAMGVAAVLIEVCLSGFASVYFEKVVKCTSENLSVWDRNFQLALHSIVFYVLYDVASKAVSSQFDAVAVENVHHRGFFHGFSWVSWLLAFLGGAGGLLVALTVKVADSVVKTLGVSFSIVLSTISSHFLLSGPLDLAIGIGACCATLAVLDYSFDATPTTAK